MKKLIRAFSLFSLFFLLYGCSSSGNTYMEKRAAIDKMSADAVSKLSEKNATASREIKNGYGYAVFSNSNVTVLYMTRFDDLRSFFRIFWLYFVAYSNSTDIKYWAQYQI